MNGLAGGEHVSSESKLNWTLRRLVALGEGSHEKVVGTGGYGAWLGSSMMRMFRIRYACQLFPVNLESVSWSHTQCGPGGMGAKP